MIFTMPSKFLIEIKIIAPVGGRKTTVLKLITKLLVKKYHKFFELVHLNEENHSLTINYIENG